VADRIALITGDFHQQLAEEMVGFVKEELAAGGAEAAGDIRVAGSYEVPLVLDRVLADTKIDGAVVLGYIDKGETLHGEVMGHIVFRVILDLELKHGKPVGMGIIGPGATPEQAEARKESAARGAVRAVLRSLATLQELK
jgi:6,7-dimethyl-8-ribityllumazine synthase